MSAPVRRTLFVYESDACLREIDIEPGYHYLGVDEQGRLQVSLSIEALADAFARFELLKDGSASLRARSPEAEMYVNERPMREAPLSPGDEILLCGFMLTWAERKNLKGYVFADEKTIPLLIVEDGDNSAVKVTAALPHKDWDQLELGNGAGTHSGSTSQGASGYQLGRLTRQMSSLLLTSREINSLSDPHAVIDKAIDYLFSVLFIERAAVLMRVAERPEPDIARVAYRRGRPPGSIRLPSSITSQCLQSRTGLLVVNASEDPRYRSKPSVVQGSICSAMALPLLHGDDLLGALYVDTSNPAVQFSVDDLKFMAVFANLLTVAVRNARLVSYLERKTTALQAGQPRDMFFIDESPAGASARRLLERVAPSNVTVLLTGESGVGKELAARRLHGMSPRASEPFLAINCAALPDSLIESELFGYEKGAFTGAERTKPGKFELADGGTLLLDEIGEIPPAFQAKLLRVLEGHGFERVGGTRTVRPDVRLIAATNRDLVAAVRAGTYREDLYYRLSVFPIHLPALRERREDIWGLTQHFVRHFADSMNVAPLQFTNAAREALESHPWPGNVRELRNLIERLTLLSDGQPVREATLREAFAVAIPSPLARQPSVFMGSSAPWNEPSVSASNPTPQAMPTSLWDHEAEAIRKALAASGGNKSKASRLLGISRHHLIYRIKKFGIEA